MTGLGRIMCLDHGQHRLGVAVSDPLRLTAKPHSVIQRDTLTNDFSKLGQIIAEQEVEMVVIGLPTDADNRIGSQASTVIRWGRKLSQTIQTPIVFWDESYSSEQAAKTEEARRRRAKSESMPIDDLAAAVILQDYLSVSNSNYEPGTPLELYDYIE